MDSVDEIKSRLSIYEVVSPYVSLKKAGKNYKGVCPFHQEKTPSFVVSPGKEIFYCFGCKKGGDIFEFIQAMERVDFKGSLELLADKAGIVLKANPKAKEIKSQKEKTKNIYRVLNNFFVQNLKDKPEVKQYLLDRGMSEESITSFQLGFAPDSYEASYTFLLEKGFTRQEIVDAGVGITKEIDQSQIYDRFRNRIIFPLCNPQGNIVGFAGRIIEEGEPKYLNSPETVLYKKSHFLYNLDKAKDAARKSDQILVMEGYMDVIASFQAGVHNIVASSGTALTADQMKILKRYAEDIVFCFDGDQAGFEATKRAIETGLDAGIMISVLALPKNIKDPDEYIKKYGDKAWQELSTQKVPFMDYLIQYASSKWDLKSMEGKKAASLLLFPLLARLPTAIMQDHYARLCAETMNVSVKSISQDLTKHSGKPQHRPVEAPVQPAEKVRYSFEEYLLGLLLNYSEYFPLVEEIIDEELYDDNRTKKFYKTIKNHYNTRGNLQLDTLFENVERDDRKYLSILSLFIDEKFVDARDEIIKKEVITIARKIQIRNIKQYLQEESDPQKIKDKLVELQSIMSQLHTV